MADLSLAQSLIAASKPRDITEGIFDRQAASSARAFETAFGVGSKVGGAIAKTTNELSTDAERYQLLQELVQRDPRRWGEALTQFNTFQGLTDRKKKRAARRSLNKILPNKSTLRQLISVSGGSFGRGRGAAGEELGLKFVKEAGNIQDRWLNQLKERKTAIEKQAGPSKEVEAYNEFNKGAISIAGSLAGRDPGTLAAMGQQMGQILQGTGTLITDPALIGRYTESAYNKIEQDLTKNFNKIFEQFGEDKNLTPQGIMAAMPNLVIAGSIVNDEEFERISNFLAPTILREISGNNPAIYNNPTMNQNMATMIKESMKSKALERSKALQDSLKNQVQLLAHKMGVDFKGDINKLDINQINEVFYNTLTQGSLSAWAPKSRAEYNQAVKNKTGNNWQWLKTFAFMSGNANYNDIRNDDLMEGIVIKDVPYNFLAEKSHLKGLEGRFKRAYHKRLKEVTDKEIRSNPVSFAESILAGGKSFFDTAIDFAGEVTGLTPTEQ